jgi:hypothetical protein
MHFLLILSMNQGDGISQELNLGKASNESSANTQKPCDFHHKAFCFGGGRWIRTTEVFDNRFTVCPLWPLGNSPIFIFASSPASGEGRAGGRIRTPDLLITNQLLYRLSYTSKSLMLNDNSKPHPFCQ